MRQEKTDGAKIARYNVREEYAREMDERQYNGRGTNAPLFEESYLIAVCEKPEPEGVYYIAEKTTIADGVTSDPLRALAFETFADAARYMVENCEIENMPRPVPRGYERPKFPRVCYSRVYVEIDKL